ncbi:NPCBM/NEW2 domain-containing protein [Dactylosporangium sp. CA-052675]|uniref:NPCBM/NEW2 domain-containing protein n=1 Tax=Dactylosporangium sp. CA-052675 TaxID=3239927 RepID=UPI003D8DAEB9
MNIALAVLAAVVAALLGWAINQLPPLKHHVSAGRRVGLVVALVLISVVVTLAVPRPESNPNANSNAGTAATPTTAPPVTTADAAPTTTGTSPDVSRTDSASTSPTDGESSMPTGPPPVPEPTYLADLSLTDHDKKSGTGLWSEGSYSTNGTSYPHSIRANAGCSNGDSGDFWLDYNISRAYAGFTTTVGLDDTDSSGVTMSYAILIDGNTLAQGTLTQGMSKRLSVSVKGGLRLRLFLHDSKRYQCGIDDWRAYMVWGQATLTP